MWTIVLVLFCEVDYTSLSRIQTLYLNATGHMRGYQSAHPLFQQDILDVVRRT